LITNVAIKDGKITAIDENLPTTSAKKTIQISGLYLTPGLVDIHVHVLCGNSNSSWKNGEHRQKASIEAFSDIEPEAYLSLGRP
jgi:dihydroorotase